MKVLIRKKENFITPNAISVQAWIIRLKRITVKVNLEIVKSASLYMASPKIFLLKQDAIFQKG